MKYTINTNRIEGDDSMKILVVGGSFDNDGGKPSGLVKKVYNAIIQNNETVDLYNGGYYSELSSLLMMAKDYDVVFWWANVPNDLPKIRDVKDIAPHIMLVSSKRNDNNKYSDKELIERVISIKADIAFEFKKVNQNQQIFNIRVFDPLGSVWYDGTDITDAVNAVLNQLSSLNEITE